MVALDKGNLVADMAAVADLIERIVRPCARESERDGDSGPAALNSFPLGDLPAEALTLVRELVEVLGRDPAVADNTTQEELVDAVASAVDEAARVLESDQLDPTTHASRLLEALTAGVVDYYVLMPVAGLDMAPGSTLELAGFQFGRLSPAERRDLTRMAVRVGNTMLLQQGDEPGTALPLVLEQTRRFLESGLCWARGTIRAKEDTVESVARERAGTLGLSILRCFLPYIGLSPDQHSLGEPEQGATQFMTIPGSPTDYTGSYTQKYSRVSRRLPHGLGAEAVEALNSHPLFAAASRIAHRYPQTEMEEVALKAMVQFGLASSIDPLEIKLPNYLTVLEVLFLGEHDYGDHSKKVSRRLGSEFTPAERDECRDDLERLYKIRQMPVHRAERNLLGKLVVSEQDVAIAASWACAGIMLALRRGIGFPSKADWVEALDREGNPPPPDHTTYLFVHRHDPATGQYVASCPDFPDVEGAGNSVREALTAVRQHVDAEVDRLRDRNEVAPVPSARAEKIAVRTP